MNKADFLKKEKIFCERCGRDLTIKPELSMIQIVDDNTTKKIARIVSCCKGECDKKLLLNLKENECGRWKDLTVLFNPIFYIEHMMAILNHMYDGGGFESEKVFEDYKNLMLKCYPYVIRNLTEEEITQMKYMNMLPF